MKKYLIFGNGYMAHNFLEALHPDGEISTKNICDLSEVESVLSEKPEYVINCAGKTGKPNIDWCEDHKEETMMSNVQGAITLATACSKRGIHFTQVGSGCIYEGVGFKEEDEPNFYGSFYSRTKILCEKALKEFPALIVRLRMPLDGTTNPKNFISKITKYKKVI